MSLLPAPYNPTVLTPDEAEPYLAQAALHSLGSPPILPADVWSFPSGARDRVLCAMGLERGDGLSDGELRVMAATAARRALMGALRSDTLSKPLKSRRIRGGGGSWVPAPSQDGPSAAVGLEGSMLGLGLEATSSAAAATAAAAQPPSPASAPSPVTPASSAADLAAKSGGGVFGKLFGGKDKAKLAPTSAAASGRSNSTSFSAAPSNAAATSFSSQAANAGSFNSAANSAKSPPTELVPTAPATLALQTSYMQMLSSLKYNPISVRKLAKPNFTTAQFQGALSRIAGMDGATSGAGDKTEFGFSSGRDEEGLKKGWEPRWGAARDLGAGKYSQNEDGVVCAPRLEEAVRMESVVSAPSYFAIFDGHGPSSPGAPAPASGPMGSAYAAVYLHAHLGSLLNEGASINDAIRGAFGETSDGLKRYRDREYPNADPGTTASILLRFPPAAGSSDAIYHLAWAGDSPCFVVSASGKSIKMLTTLHNATNPDEVKRVEKLGGKFYAPPNAPSKEREGPQERLQGYLACSRGLGDFAYRPYVSWEPDTLSFSKSSLGAPPTMEPAEEWKFLVLCSDGVSDFLPPESLAAVVKRGYGKGGDGYYYNGCEAAAREVVREAVKRGGYDNTSCIVVEL